MAKQSDCSICCDTFNKSTRKEVICPFADCNYSCCKTCIRTYLLSTVLDPHCMNCKKPWEQKFIVENLNRTFCEKEYKSHRKDLLVDREISKLPETMHLAEREKKITVEKEKAKVFREKYLKLQKEVAILKQEYSKCNNNIYIIRYNAMHNCDEVGAERKKFIMSCPNNDCRGYLSTQYKCELCQLFTCPHCLEILGYTKTDEHVCNPDNISSAELIKKETKACPSCGVRIFKISGCSQIWCTECKVAFDYNTGKIDTGVIHNPHYYAHMRQLNNGQVPRNPQDICCGGLCTVYQLQNIIITKVNTIYTDADELFTMTTYLGDIHRSLSHINYRDLPRVRTLVRDNQDFENLRIEYILGKKDKKQMGTQIYKRDNQRKKNTELLHLYELLSVVGTENFNTLSLPTNLIKNKKDYTNLIDDKIKILDNLREYCNGEFAKISVAYNYKALLITDTWDIDYKKYRISEVV